MEVFNNGMPLRVVRGDDGRMGVVDEARMRVWFGYDFRSTRVPRIPAGDCVTLPPLPSHYGKFEPKAIGGVSKTVRRVGCIRTTHKHTGAVVVFATQAPTPTCVAEAMGAVAVEHTVGDSEVDEEFGNVTEIVVHESSDVDTVCAVVARCGAIPILEDNSLNALQGIGVERLDRIPSKSVDGEENDDESQFGARRGEKNWRFAWLPNGWHPPITWDHMIRNVESQDIETLPQPLRQHVAQNRINRGVHELLGSRWRVAETPPTPSELGRTHQGPGTRTILDCPALSAALVNGGGDNVSVPVHIAESLGLDSIRYLAMADDGRWYRPRDTRSILNQQIPGRRLVSAALEDSQSEQLITVFYLLSIERVSDPHLCEAATLILFRYMFERGYTARWMGKYVQDALYIGNGIRFRPFKRLSQYAPDRLPAKVLIKLCGTDGRLKNKGSKGTRSKYRTTNRYVPNRRLKRTPDHESSMITHKIPRHSDAATSAEQKCIDTRNA